jgi:DNA invertase Pin-like site-specific DNA recombinase
MDRQTVIDREAILKQWDEWRTYIAAGGSGSWPRDAFEALLDELEAREWGSKQKKGK